MDIATSIWNWEDKKDKIEYKEPKPNVFFSLKKARFTIGLRLSSNCQDTQVLNNVRRWLIDGLSQGIGSQVNTGYGELKQVGDKEKSDREFFRLRFNIEGQLIHGHKKFRDLDELYERDRKTGEYKYSRGRLKPDMETIAETRPIAFKSTLRYWFRVFSLGVLAPATVREWETKLFGGIKPNPTLGLVKVSIKSGKSTKPERGKEKDIPEDQQGILVLSYSCIVTTDEQKSISSLIETLLWLMLNLGGVGLGSRRPCYSRKDRPYRPWFRGCTFYLDENIENPDSFWYTPKSAKEYQKILKRRIREFYSDLVEIIPNSSLDKNIESPFGTSTTSQWYEVLDSNARIIVCSGRAKNKKPYALATLHDHQFKHEVTKKNDRIEWVYDGNLCGKTGDPSPIWVTEPFPIWNENLNDYQTYNYQVVTVFGANQSPRSDFLTLLEDKNRADGADEYYQVFPF